MDRVWYRDQSSSVVSVDRVGGRNAPDRGALALVAKRLVYVRGERGALPLRRSRTLPPVQRATRVERWLRSAGVRHPNEVWVVRPARLELATSWFVARKNAVSLALPTLVAACRTAHGGEQNQSIPAFRFVPSCDALCRSLVRAKGKKRATSGHGSHLQRLFDVPRMSFDASRSEELDLIHHLVGS